MNEFLKDGVKSASGTAIDIVESTGVDITLSTDGHTGVYTFSTPETSVRYAEVELTNAEIKALAATPKTLVAAPGAGKVIEFVSAVFKLNYGSEVLTESADNLAIKYTDASGVSVSGDIETTGFIDQSADTITNAIAQANTIVAAASAENQALVLDNTGDGEFGGNASNDTTITVGIAYRVHTL